MKVISLCYLFDLYLLTGPWTMNKQCSCDVKAITDTVYCPIWCVWHLKCWVIKNKPVKWITLQYYLASWFPKMVCRNNNMKKGKELFEQFTVFHNYFLTKICRLLKNWIIEERINKKDLSEDQKQSLITFLYVIYFRIDEPHVILSGSDSDDDVQFIEATYEPLLVASKPTKPASDSPQQPPQLLQQLQQPQPLLPRPLQPVLLQQSPQLMKSPIPCQVVPHSPLLSPR